MNIKKKAYSMLRAGVGNNLLHQSYTLDFKENKKPGN